MKPLLLVALAGCSAEPRVFECPACVCEQARACPVYQDDSMDAYLEGVAHGQKTTLDAIALDLCFEHAGTNQGWQRRFDKCMSAFHAWEEHARPETPR